MGNEYTRQSSSAIVDGSTIQAADLNNEFNKIQDAFSDSAGHTHDGTTAEGGRITKLEISRWIYIGCYGFISKFN